MLRNGTVEIGCRSTGVSLLCQAVELAAAGSVSDFPPPEVGQLKGHGGVVGQTRPRVIPAQTPMIGARLAESRQTGLASYRRDGFSAGSVYLRAAPCTLSGKTRWQDPEAMGKRRQGEITVRHSGPKVLIPEPKQTLYDRKNHCGGNSKHEHSDCGLKRAEQDP
jgi:hypothetical protein